LFIHPKRREKRNRKVSTCVGIEEKEGHKEKVTDLSRKESRSKEEEKKKLKP